MEDNNKVYGTYSYLTPYLPRHQLFRPSPGFTITMYEYQATIETLWKTTKGTSPLSSYLGQKPTGHGN